MGAGLFSNLLSNTIAPSINRATGGSNLGTIGANVIGNNLFGPQTGEFKMPEPGYWSGPALEIDDPQPGYQQPPMGQMPQGQDNQQYYQQMRKSIDGMNEAFSQIEKMQMPGGQYPGSGGGGGYTPGGGKGGKGISFDAY